ncbi:glycine-rich domain-containing protein [Mastigocoleus testarum]|uniref:Glycine-rich domain-containing protein-like n=1 Tax=Mastigocoleus testarum BC008 TaxID=371196 RepID=A0A0V7ZHY2_9CYAN|nr:glycine-rich domain-containing protein-like [Mastigocoleus testarum]KST63964.1 hypothetical protein BC008_39885 [Mastigocoleus testarum BC008]KST64674.1 hypothetical protein BC008_40860 [Mastigocoleus testarum BC008]
MLIAKQTVSSQIKVFTEKLRQLDLGPIAYKLMNDSNGLGWSREKTSQAISRYLMFLTLIYLYPNRQFVPSREIDLVWHFHIIDTIKYAQDCQILFGYFIHHFPYFGNRDAADRKNLEFIFKQTQVLFEEHFGPNSLTEEGVSEAADCQPIGYIYNFVRPRIEINLMELV